MHVARDAAQRRDLGQPGGRDVAADRLGPRAAANLADGDVARDRAHVNRRAGRHDDGVVDPGAAVALVRGLDVDAVAVLPHVDLDAVELRARLGLRLALAVDPGFDLDLGAGAARDPHVAGDVRQLEAAVGADVERLDLGRRVGDLLAVLALVIVVVRPAGAGAGRDGRGQQECQRPGSESRMHRSSPSRVPLARGLSLELSQGRGRSAHDGLRSRPAPLTPVRFTSLAIAIRSCSSATFWR